MEELFGYVDRITYQNGENGFTVAQIQEPRKNELTCVVGTMPALLPGETVSAKGAWKVNPQHGRQFEVNDYSLDSPADVIGIQKYLASGMVKGIGPAYAERIVKKYGAETLNVIDTSPESLSDIPGIGKKRIERIKECWQEQKSIREVMVFLQNVGVSPAYAQKIFRAYGDRSIEKVKKNPYALSRDIFGIGFKIADSIAQMMGVAKDSPQRIESGIEYVLNEQSGDGHICYPVGEFLPLAKEILEVDLELIQSCLDALQQDDRVVVKPMLFAGEQQTFLWLKKMYICERGIAREVERLKRAPSFLRNFDHEKALEWAQKELSIELAKNQIKAVEQALSAKVQIITGGPGTGKSTIINTILTIMQHVTKKVCLAAPTGRAAKRMAEITKKEAKTIHSLLKFDFKIGGFKQNRDNPLECDLMIVDEASMIDTYLMYGLLKAIPSEARVIFVGDINQLPSVGPGNVLRDMITSQRIPVTELNEIFRQAEGSAIITNAHRINSGIFPDISNRYDGDFFFVNEEEKEVILEHILNIVTSRIPKKYGYDPFDEVQVLTPMKRGILGTENLNRAIQQVLNNKQGGFMRGGFHFLEGDKVMQIRNNYKKEVFNGDIGRITFIDQNEQELVITFEGVEVVYKFQELDEIIHAYAISIHKFQGSECPCIVMPIHTCHYKLLHRNLFYTGVTRGKKLVIVAGTKKAVSIAVRNNEVEKRYTGLLQAILDMKV